jgi:hypothetical protein
MSNLQGVAVLAGVNDSLQNTPAEIRESDEENLSICRCPQNNTSRQVAS